MSKILVIGESCLDIFNYGVCNRLCPEAPVPVFNPSHSVEKGGMATNVYNNILALDAAVHLHTNNNWKNITKTRFIDYKTNHMFMRLDCKDAEVGASKIKKISFKKNIKIPKRLSDFEKLLNSDNFNRFKCIFLPIDAVLNALKL